MKHLKVNPMSMPKKKVFVSFDSDHDEDLGDFIVEQSRLAGSNFKVVGCTMKKNTPGRVLEDKARADIKGADIAVVLVSRDTHKATHVLREVKIAREEGVPIVQMIAYVDKCYDPVPEAGPLFIWSWDNLKRLLS